MGKKGYDFENAVKFENKRNKSVTINTSTPIKQKKSKPKRNTVPFYKLFRFTTSGDIVLIILMLITSIGIGIAYPFNMFIFKDVVNVIVIPNQGISFVTALTPLIINFAILASAAFLCGFIQMQCVALLSERQSRRYKDKYYSSILRQDISWFDAQQTGRLITKLTDDIESIEVAISDKLAQFVQNISSFCGSFIIAMINGWMLTLAGCITIPFLCLTFFLMIHFIKKYAIEQIKAYSIAGGISEEILSGIRTVVAFNAQEKEERRYTANLFLAEKYGIKKAIFQGFGSGLVGFIMFFGASLVFYLGIGFIKTYAYSPGVVVQIFLTILIGSTSLGFAIPMIENFMTAKAAAYDLFEVIDRKPDIDTQAGGMIPESFDGDIKFTNVNFEYASRAGVQVLKKFSFTIPNGKTVAFIGPSGSGKSTIVHLLQRFYDPTSGSVTLNGMNLKSIDLNWYRSNIGVVQQEPSLFSGSIEENFKLGKEFISHEEIVQATKDSNAYDFIMETKEQFDVKLGDMGSGFSGGQKQRIAIAVALVRKPKLLLLDEATSALDNTSEKLVQKALDQAILSEKRTVVMIAHRLQTVRNADIIVVMKNGEIVEQGSHNELLKMKGMYYDMLQIQKNKESSYTSPLISNDEEVYENIEKVETSEKISEDIINADKKSKFQLSKDFSRIMKLNKSESCLLTVGVISSIIVGATFPGASLIYAQMFEIFSNLNNPPVMISKGNIFCGLLLLPGLVLVVFQFLKNFCLGKAGEILTTRLRSLLMRAMLKQEMAWFDMPENISGVLTARLAQEASLVKGIAGIQLSVYIEALSTLIMALIIAFYFNWMITLLFFLFIPFITFSGIMKGKMSSNQRLTETSSVHSSALVMETFNNIRTVQSRGLQKHFSDLFLKGLKINGKGRKCKMFLYGLLSAFSESALYFSYCIIFYVGGILIDQNKLQMIDLMRVFSCLTISSASLGRALALAPDAEKARKAARQTLQTLDRVTNINADHSIGEKPNNKLTGKIEFKNIYFRYPSRMNIPVLKGIDLEVKPGETVALVGHSGCGKSTLIQLLERYYDPIQSPDNSNGQILLDGMDLKVLNLLWVRNQIGLVKQEPSLFNMSILENITYGSDEESRLEDVYLVAKMANIHDFIVNLPEGYSTKVGQRGGHLSGGQKQRICIARALYNKPAILLLDEATSALDSESEKVVQEALDRARENCTCLIIAHRLSTIQNADKIVVIDNGIVQETGTHGTLMAKKGLYYQFNVQNIN